MSATATPLGTRGVSGTQCRRESSQKLRRGGRAAALSVRASLSGVRGAPGTLRGDRVVAGKTFHFLSIARNGGTPTATPGRRKTRNRGPFVQVGAPGFEPGTSCSQSTRATKLRHAPSGREYRRSERPDGYGSRCDLGQAGVDDLGDAWIERVEDDRRREDDGG